MEEKKVSIEENLLELNKIVKSLESGELTLEEALQSFENGVRLVKESDQLLTAAETKLKVLQDDGSVNDF